MKFDNPIKLEHQSNIAFLALLAIEKFIKNLPEKVTTSFQGKVNGGCERTDKSRALEILENFKTSESKPNHSLSIKY